MVTAQGLYWTADFGEIAEAEQFRVGYAGDDLYSAYFPIGQLQDLITSLTNVIPLGLDVLSLGTQVQSRKVSTGFHTEVVIEPRSDTFPPQIMRAELTTLSDLISVLSSLQALMAGQEPADWDGSKLNPAPYPALPPELSPDALSRMIGSVADDAQQTARSFARGAALRGAAMGCALFLVSTKNVSNSSPTSIAFNDEQWDSDSLHSNSTNTSRITIPDGGDGIWRIKGSIEFAANASGVTREALIYRNGGARAADRRPSIGAGRATVVNVDLTIPAVAGDYFELFGYQDSGSTLTAGTTYTRFEATRMGDAIGIYTSTAGARLFSGDVKYKGFDRYSRIPGTQPANQVYVADDPVNGAARQVMHVQVKNADNSVSYPRAQFQSPSSLTSGDDLYVRFDVFVPTDFASMTGTRSPVIHEIYGPPTSGYGPNVLRIRDNKFALEPTAIYDTGGVATGAYLSWSLALTGLKGQWVGFIHRIKMSNDAGVGLHELWVNTGSGWVQQTLKDPTTGSSVGNTLNLATIRTGVNDSGNNFSSLKVAYTDYSIGDVTLWYANHSVNTSLAAAQVDPL